MPARTFLSTDHQSSRLATRPPSRRQLVEGDSALLHPVAMAAVAIVDQDRLDLFLKPPDGRFVRSGGTNREHGQGKPADERRAKSASGASRNRLRLFEYQPGVPSKGREHPWMESSAVGDSAGSNHGSS